ncbi:sugar ABC transporter substrate-binding protein [Pseudarthrobacter sp. J75]|uniref:ABC transporter substrate-binding protein n=1 Tax=unclassified Pseudarthrobacter TaxID=2647000 RepID=UPI002E8148A3|nr:MULTISPECIES: sugar ABC transporter substrate-binding protein [unclassified Pseudarthrobacter]MEE2523143.1 sugar ABC transporter substrate-binding protein [Pseudarthrobacter sp. J47]MEE2529827.1 sugar ABC transporter substrate-binding protein [Pseudarthrobacter sp. J75]MEE2569144.1 sugar ABC transporter substrate-binding protein [Pseudarthrobacter sp. J64]
MPLNRKPSIVIAAGLLSAALLAGCGGAETGTTASSAPAEPQETVEITFSSWLKGSKQVVDAFNAAQDEVNVTFNEVASSKDNYPQLTNQVKAGNAPDVITVEYPRVAEMASQGVLKDITKEAGDLVKDNYSESTQSLVNFGGSTWSVPLDAGVLQMYYRADLFEQYGIEVPKTWEEYKAAAEKVVAADPNVRLGASAVGDGVMYAALAWQNGAKWGDLDGDSWKVDIASDKSKEALEIHQEMYDEKLLWSDEAPVLQQKQAAGQMLSVISGSWYGAGLQSTYADQAGKWRIAPVPSPTSTPAAALYGGSTFGISENSEKAEAGVKFIKWMTTTPEGIEARIAGGTSTVFPVNEEARKAASKAFAPDFFGGQNIYEVAGEGLANVPEGWVWGPGTATTLAKLTDGSAQVKAGSTKLADILPPAQEATVADLKNRGISVK